MIPQSRLRAYLTLGVLLAAAAPLAGCVVAAAGGMAAGGYSLATEQRTPEQLARDAAIAATAHKYWADQSSDLARDVEATVYDGRILVTGMVPNQAMKDAAEASARRIDGVQQVYDEIQIGPPTNLAQDARDDYASNVLRANLLADSDIRSTNYTIHVLNGVVYIIGYARTAEERDRVLNYARNIANVQRVAPFIEIGTAPPPPGTAAPAPSAPPPGPAAPPVAAPRGTIEVTPLP